MKVLRTMPIACVDLMIQWNDRYLLVRRNREPLKGIWWPPGGRIYRGETAIEAVVRKAKYEVGMEVEGVRFEGFYEAMFEKSDFPDTGVHSISLVFSCYPKTKESTPRVLLDDTSDDKWWAENLPKEFIVQKI